MKTIYKNVSALVPDSINVLIIAGIHGNESHAVQVAQELYKQVAKLENICTIDFIFTANKYGLEKNTRDNGYTNVVPKDCNRLFPKSYKTSEEVKQQLEDLQKEREYNLVLDIHNSPMCVPCVLIDYDNKADKLLKACWNTKLVPLVRATQIGTIKKLFNQNNNTYAYTVEIPIMGVTGYYQRGCEYLIDFINKFSQNRKLEITRSASEILTHTLFTQLDNGIIYYEKEIPVGTYKKGDIICMVKSLYDDKEEIIYAPYDGMLYDVEDNLYSYSGKAFGIYGKTL